MACFEYRRFFGAVFFLILIGQKLHALQAAEELFFPADNAVDNEALKNADLLFEAGFFDRAIDAYKKIMAEKPFGKDNKNEARFHLGLLYVSEQKYDEAISLLKESGYAENEDTAFRNSQFLLGVAYKYADKLNLAKEAFKAYTSLSQPLNLKLYDQARFQIALIEFELENYKQAKELFSEISSLKESRLGVLANLYIAHIEVEENNYEAALETLQNLRVKIPPGDPLTYELSFLFGEVAFQSRDYLEAIDHFERSLQSGHAKDSSWNFESLYRLGWSYLKLSESTTGNEELKHSLEKAENIFTKLVESSHQEKASLALAECYLNQAKLLKKQECYAKAEAILADLDEEDPHHFQSLEGKTHALLLRARAASTYEKRQALYKELTSTINKKNARLADGWYMRAMNDFEEGLVSINQKDVFKSRKMFCEAIAAFGEAFEIFKNSDKKKAVASLKYQALSMGYLGDEQSDLYAFKLIDNLIFPKTGLSPAEYFQDELFYLHGYFASRLIKNDESRLQIALKSLELSRKVSGQFLGPSLKLIGTLHFQNNDFEMAEKTYLELVDRCEDPSLIGEALFLSARCGEILQKDKDLIAERKRRVFESYPASPFAADAYFTLYSYQEYLQGDKAAIKHLQNFEDKFKVTHFLIEAYYLLGLDSIRDRKTPDGKWIRKKSMTAAIDAFQHVETLYDTLNENGEVPDLKKEYYAAIRYRSTLHRAMANLAIAEEAKGAKQHIYLDYAEEVFKALIKDLENPENPYVLSLVKNACHPNIYEESIFGLAKTYTMAEADDKADNTLLKLIQYYKDSDIAHGYYPARSWDERGRIALRKKAYKEALAFFNQAEECAKGNYLGTDQKLDLWIQQSLCNRGLQDFDEAILILSKVVNDDAVSSLRMKAMYLRAETYELQGRPEFAKKQLESMVKKGGSWAKKAKEKLRNEYGY